MSMSSVRQDMQDILLMVTMVVLVVGAAFALVRFLIQPAIREGDAYRSGERGCADHCAPEAHRVTNSICECHVVHEGKAAWTVEYNIMEGHE